MSCVDNFSGLFFALCYYLSIAVSKLYMKLKIKQHKTVKEIRSIEVKRGKLSQKAMMRERGIPTWNMMLLAAKGI